MSLIDQYKKEITPKPHIESEKDIILISYGDHVYNDEEKPLKTLKHFLDEHCQGCINSAHILPFYPYSSDDGFSVIDYVAVDEKLGSWTEVKDIGSEYRLMCDAVVNHMSSKSDWFLGYLAGDDKYDNYFVDTDPSLDLSMVVRPRTSPLLTPFEAADGTTKHIWTTFSADQVDLNYSNYKVLIEVLNVLFTYVKNGATLIRLDAIAFLWKQPGTDSVHLQQTHEIIQLMREVLHQVSPEVIIITETNVPHQENISYFGSGHDEAQMVYNFALPPLIAFSMMTQDASRMTRWAQHLWLPSDRVCFFNFTASHDGIGMRPISEILTESEVQDLVDMCTTNGGRVSYRDCGNGTIKPYELNCTFKDLLTHPDKAEEERMERMLLSQAIALAMPGVPGIYLSSLFGAGNWNEGVEQTGVNRSINRQKFSASDLESYLAETSHQEFFEKYKKLIGIRSHEPAFNPYLPFEFLNLHKSVFAISKKCDNYKLLCLFNVSQSDIELDLAPFICSDGCTDLISESKVTNNYNLKANDFVWLKTGEPPSCT